MDSAPPQGATDYFTRMDELLVKLNERLERTNQLQEQNQQLLQAIAQRSSGGSGGYAPIDDIGASPPTSLSMRGGWHYDVEDVDGEVFDGGETETFDLKSENPGFVLSANILVSGPGGEETTVIFKTDGWRIDSTIEKLKNAGYTSGGTNFHPFVTVYDDQNDVFGASFNNTDGYHWKNDVKLQIDFPDSINEVELGATLVRVVIDDMDEFTSIQHG